MKDFVTIGFALSSACRGLANLSNLSSGGGTQTALRRAIVVYVNFGGRHSSRNLKKHSIRYVSHGFSLFNIE